MKKWFWWCLLVLLAIAAIVSTQFPQQNFSVIQESAVKVQEKQKGQEDETRRQASRRSPNGESFTNYQLPTTNLKSKIQNPKSKIQTSPNVSEQKLMAHVRALNYRRYTPAERDRARNYLTKSLKQFGWQLQLQTFEGGVNIFTQRQGTDPAAGAILVAAHYDTVSVSPGADDNASGVAVVLEVARLLGLRSTPRTLQLALFDREESGLLGSRAFVADEKQLENLHGAIVMDMVGFACHTAGCQKYPQGLPIVPPSDRGDFLVAVGDMEHASLLDAFQPSHAENLPLVFPLPVPLKGMLMPDTLRSDHAPFWYQGVGAVLLTDTANLRTPHYHQSSDTPATLDESFFTGSAQIVVNAITKLLESSEQ